MGRYIVCWFGTPHTIVLDNDNKINVKTIATFYKYFGIKQNFSAPCQVNRKVEATNKTLLDTLKKRLKRVNGKWVKQLLAIFWEYWTTPNHSMGLSLFHLAYSLEAVLPTKIMAPTSMTKAVKIGYNEHILQNDTTVIDKTSYSLLNISSNAKMTS